MGNFKGPNPELDGEETEEKEELIVALESALPKTIKRRNKTGKGEEHVPHSSFACFLAEVDKHPLLRREEEEALTKAAKKGDAEAIEKLILSNLRLIINIAKYYNRKKTKRGMCSLILLI